MLVPARHDRQAVRNLSVAAAELDGGRAVFVFLRRETVERIAVERIFPKESIGIIKRNGSEAIDRYVRRSDQSVNARAIVVLRRNV